MHAMKFAKIFETLEQDILMVGGDIKLCRMVNADPLGYLDGDEDRLGEALALIQELKDILSNLATVE